MRLRTWSLSPYSSPPRDSAGGDLAPLPAALLCPSPFSPQASSAEQLRKEGNELFKCGDYEGALTAYTQALSLGATPQDQAILHRNRAACHLKLVRGSGCSNLPLPSLGLPIAAVACPPAGQFLGTHGCQGSLGMGSGGSGGSAKQGCHSISSSQAPDLSLTGRLQQSRIRGV